MKTKHPSISGKTEQKAARAILALILMGGSVSAQSHTFAYRFDYNGVQAYKADIRPSLNTEGRFPGTSSQRWAGLLSSGFVIGGTRGLTRAADPSEDYEFNWYDPAGPTNRNFYDQIDSSGADTSVLTSDFPRKLQNGIHSGVEPLFSGNLLAMGDDNYMMYDPDGSVSIYNYPGGLLEGTDPAWTTFTGGAYGNQSLASRLGNMIGYEEGYMWFLEGENTIYGYGAFTGDGMVSYTNNFTGDLAGYSMRQLIDGEVPNMTYAGWDVGAIAIGTSVIPEPGSALLACMTGAVSLLRRRRRN